ncbi:glycosyltransferase [Sandaracinus amylolyticus]|uniref:Glycosyl transferase group 1 n=1 Tax=Sandaracinus amylolyticus TaxID=927083 RepID=A0A0F6SEE6_9BACT|nr:glycosyltransferase [Sandaracinus amylolyticus]AKF05059.1 glycosyl transferase group 1 [Sandaracinus amylolyticus]
MSIEQHVSADVLHVAALPFPSPQGTQAAIAAMMRALADADRDARLLTYAHGAAESEPPRFTHLRLRRAYGDRSLRSGPSLAKIAQDVALARAIAQARPEIVVAHHVEAAGAALMARAPRVVFVAHTALGPELPTYFAARWGGIAMRAGDALDRALVRRADAALAVSPVLARTLSTLADREVRWLPIPWALAAPITPDERVAARAALGLAAHDEVLLYAGNLDRYQGLDALWSAFAALRARRPALQLVVATASDTRDAPGRVVALDGSEAQRRALHAAADLVVVPRESEGGLPIKLIDALARGVPAVCVPRATAGLALDDVVLASPQLADAIDRALDDRELRAQLATAGPRFVARELSASRFLAVLDGVLSEH